MLRKKRHTEAEIATKLAEAGNLAAEGRTQDAIAETLGISVMTFHRWRKAHHQPAARSNGGGARETGTLVPIARPSDPGRRNHYAALQLENTRLRKLVTDLLLEKMRFEEEWHQNSHRAVAKKR